MDWETGGLRELSDSKFSFSLSTRQKPVVDRFDVYSFIGTQCRLLQIIWRQSYSSFIRSLNTITLTDWFPALLCRGSPHNIVSEANQRWHAPTLTEMKCCYMQIFILVSILISPLEAKAIPYSITASGLALSSRVMLLCCVLRGTIYIPIFLCQIGSKLLQSCSVVCSWCAG